MIRVILKNGRQDLILERNLEMYKRKGLLIAILDTPSVKPNKPNLMIVRRAENLPPTRRESEA